MSSCMRLVGARARGAVLTVLLASCVPRYVVDPELATHGRPTEVVIPSALRMDVRVGRTSFDDVRLLAETESGAFEVVAAENLGLHQRGPFAWVVKGAIGQGTAHGTFECRSDAAQVSLSTQNEERRPAALSSCAVTLDGATCTVRPSERGPASPEASMSVFVLTCGEPATYVQQERRYDQRTFRGRDEGPAYAVVEQGTKLGVLSLMYPGRPEGWVRVGVADDAVRRTELAMGLAFVLERAQVAR